MIAFVLKNQFGVIRKGWILQKGQPDLSSQDLIAIAEKGYSLEEVSVEDALKCDAIKNGPEKKKHSLFGSSTAQHARSVV